MNIDKIDSCMDCGWGYTHEDASVWFCKHPISKNFPKFRDRIIKSGEASFPVWCPLSETKAEGK